MFSFTQPILRPGNLSGEDGRPCLRFGAAIYMPHMTITNNATHHTYTGVMPVLFDIFAKRLGRCYEFVHYSVGGSFLPNGTYTGGVGLASRGEIDASSIMMIAADRFWMGDWSEFIYIDEHTSGYQRPLVQSDIAGFIRPFVLGVWVLMLMALVGVFVAFLLLHFLQQRLMVHRPHRNGGGQVEKDQQQQSPGAIADLAAGWSVCVLLGQAVPLEPPRGVAKALTGLWMLLSLILATVYRCNLKAMLISPKVTLPFNTLEEMVDAGLPNWIPLHSLLSSVAYYADPASIYGRLNRTVYNYDMEYSIPFGVQGFVEGKHVASAVRTALLQIITSHYSKTGKCTTYLMDEGFLKNAPNLVMFPKGSPLREKLNFLIRSLREFGIFDHWYKELIANGTECFKPVTAESGRALELRDYYGVFSIYAGGVVMAVGCFLLELVMTRPAARGSITSS